MAFNSKKIIIHTPEQIERIKVAAQKTAEVRDRLIDSLKPGITTLLLNQLAGQFINDVGGKSAFLGYRGFPGNVCISVNEEVVHGIGRRDRVIQFGDIVSFDVGVEYNKAIGDSAKTACIGPPTGDVERLLKATEESLNAAIKVCLPGNHINEIGKAVESVINKEHFGIVRDFVGHGVGMKLHEPPEIPNFSRKDKGPRLKPGMVIAIEPMINIGTHKVKVLADSWTVVSVDNTFSAHFEHTILITETKPEVLTWRKTQ